jgi:DNA primase
MDQITEIKQKLDIIDVIGGYVSLQKSGRNYKGLCPFHGEKTPSFMVSQELQMFKCFGCSEGGDIFKFIQKIEGVEFPDALQILADRAGVELVKTYNEENKKKQLYYEINRVTALFYRYLLLKHPLGKKALEYLKVKRRLSDETIDTFMLGYAPDTWDALYRALSKKGFNPSDMLETGVIVKRSNGSGYIDKFRGRVIFPLREVGGKIVAFSGRTIINAEPKYLNTSETTIFHKTSTIYGLDRAKVAIKQEGVIFVEGQVDVISAHQFGFKNVVASGGTSLTTNQLKIISRYTKDVIFCFDSDNAGTSAISRAIELAEKDNFNVRVIPIPGKYKDLDELLHEDLSLAKEVIANPIPVYDFYLAKSFKKFDKKSALGKKQIIEELTPVFNKVSNKVILDHYTKQTAEALDLNEDVVRGAFTGSQKPINITGQPTAETSSKDPQNAPPVGAVQRKSPQEYILSLLMNSQAPLDTAQTILYKLGQKDFPEPTTQEVFTALKDYLIDRKQKFKVESFYKKLNEQQRKAVDELYLWDLGDIVDEPVKLANEIVSTFDRIKKDTARREIKEIMDRMKQAEMEKDTKLVKELAERIKTLSARLI